jgi:hypothetical protein
MSDPFLEAYIMRLHPRLFLIGAVSVAALVLAPVSAIAGDGHGGHDDNGGHGNHHGDHHGDHRHHGQDLLRSGLAGSTPVARGGTAIFGVNPGGVPWVTDKGSSVRVRRDGRIDVRIEGLVIPPPDGTNTNPVPGITASLYCNATRADTTAPVTPLDTAGDGRIRDTLTLPDTCVAPVVLLNPNGNLATYIAASG